MPDTATTGEQPNDALVELWERKDVLAYFGGKRPCTPARCTEASTRAAIRGPSMFPAAMCAGSGPNARPRSIA